jgi:hypothetical protein
MTPKPGEGTPEAIHKIVREMPRPEELFRLCIEKLGYASKDSQWFREHFTEALTALMGEGAQILRGAQKKARREVVELAKTLDEDAHFELIGAGEKSFRNQMMKRAGVHMEKCSAWLLTRCGIPNEDGQKATGRSDRVCPNLQVYQDNPERSVVLEFKRTVRERWKEVRDEISRAGHSVWLITLDDYIADSLVEQIAEGNIVLYVSQEVFTKLTQRRGKLRSMNFLIEDIEHVISSRQTSFSPSAAQ